MNRHTCHIQASNGRRGFTLIELMVVIGVILLLVALTVAVGTGLMQRSEISETQNTMRLLDMAVYEWEQSYDREVTFGIDGEPCGNEAYELDQQVLAGHTWSDPDDADETAQEVTDQLWEIFSRSAPMRDLIAQVNPAFVTELSPDGKDFPDHLEQRSFRIFDAWDKEILAILPGRSYSRRCDDTNYDIDEGDRTSDIDGTIRTPFENHFGTAADRRIFFVSAGPDGTFGALHLDVEQSNLTDVEQRRIREASDNVYSYPVYTEEARK